MLELRKNVIADEKRDVILTYMALQLVFGEFDFEVTNISIL